MSCNKIFNLTQYIQILFPNVINIEIMHEIFCILCTKTLKSSVYFTVIAHPGVAIFHFHVQQPPVAGGHMILHRSGQADVKWPHGVPNLPAENWSHRIFLTCSRIH